MPYSSNSGKDHIRNIIDRVKHDRMLDVGCGSGTYAKMFPSSEWFGVEAWEPYINEFGLNSLYGTIIVGDARSVNFSSFGKFDVAILGDVLEHMEKDEAKNLFDAVRKIADTVIVSIPIGHYPQDAYNGNPFEKHVTDNWTDDDFRETFGEPTVSYIEKEIGVYCWSNQKVRPKICIYAISKNEEQFVQRWAESGRDADLLLVADTGSTDNTVEECKKAGISTHEICITPWRFDHARNASIALIPKDIDICVSLDLDEIMEPGWRQEIERVWTSQTTRLQYYFDWGCGVKFNYQKIHARHGYYWHHPCHEYPMPDGRINEIYAYTDKLLVSHHPDPTKSRGQYLDLLALSVKEDPICPRNAFYYARELSFYSRWDESIAELQRYLALPGATWINERSYAMRTLAKCYEGKGDSVQAEAWWLRSAAEAPNTREPWCGLAMLYYMQRRWQECYGAAMRALTIVDRELVYTVDPAVWGHWADDLVAVSAWEMGMKDIAVKHAQAAVEKSPNDLRLQNNLKFMQGLEKD